MLTRNLGALIAQVIRPDRPRFGDTIAVWFSCGAASAVAAHETIRQYPYCRIRIVNNPVAEEDSDNKRFADDVSRWLKRPIEFAVSDEFPDASAVSVWDKRKAMSFPHGAPCTLALKKHARQQFEARNRIDWHVLGFTADEKKRHERFTLTERENVLPVLIDADLTKADCMRVIQRAGIALPAIYSYGFPNANCVGCVKATSPTYWNLVRRTYPDVFIARAEQSRRLGVRLARVNNERVYLDELSPDAKGRPLKSFSLDCGIFCEESGDDDDANNESV